MHMLENQPFGLQFQEDFRAAMAESGRDVALDFADSHGSAAEQVAHLEHVLQTGADALVLFPVDPAPLKPALRRLQQARIPVLLVGTDVPERELRRGIIHADNVAYGRKMGEFLAEVTGGHAEILQIQGIGSTQSARLRDGGFREVLAAHPGMHLLDTLTGDWLYARARELAARWLPAHPRVECVFAQNDEMARGAWDAARALGREEDLLITGIDAIRGQGLSLVMQGKLAATLINPSAGRPAATQVLALIAGDPILEQTVLQTSLLRSNERIRAWQDRRERRRRA